MRLKVAANPKRNSFKVLDNTRPPKSEHCNNTAKLVEVQPGAGQLLLPRGIVKGTSFLCASAKSDAEILCGKERFCSRARYDAISKVRCRPDQLTSFVLSSPVPRMRK